MDPTFVHFSSFFRYLVFSLHNIKSENKKHMKIYNILMNIFFLDDLMKYWNGNNIVTMRTYESHAGELQFMLLFFIKKNCFVPNI